MKLISKIDFDHFDCAELLPNGIIRKTFSIFIPFDFQSQVEMMEKGAFVTCQEIFNKYNLKLSIDEGRIKEKCEFLALGSVYAPDSDREFHAQISVGNLKKTTLIRACDASVCSSSFQDNLNNVIQNSPKNMVGYINNSFIPLPPFAPERVKKLGAFDKNWLKTKWPGFPKDTNPEYYNLGSKDQWLDDYIRGGEVVRIVNMHPKRKEIEFELPCFNSSFFLEKGNAQNGYVIVPMKEVVDTLYLFPEFEQGILIARGFVDAEAEYYKDANAVYVEFEFGKNNSAKSYEQHCNEYLNLKNQNFDTIHSGIDLQSPTPQLALDNENNVEGGNVEYTEIVEPATNENQYINEVKKDVDRINSVIARLKELDVSQGINELDLNNIIQELNK